MKALLRAFAWIHALMAALFAAASLVLVAISARVAWAASAQGLTKATAQEVIEAVGLLAAAVVALQIAQTIAEEEVVREAHMSTPTRVRRFLSRFFVVVIVALAIEGLVATFKAVREELSQLIYAAALIASSAGLLAAWGVFVRLNRFAEELEPEAMKLTKQEDRKVEQSLDSPPSPPSESRLSS